jgi:putative copper resistance protein D
MAWLLFDEITYALAAVRAIHFAASTLILGSLLFQNLIVDSAARSGPAATINPRVMWLARAALIVAVTSGVLWFALTAASMSSRPVYEILNADVLWTVLQETQFGFISEIRLGLAFVLAFCLTFEHVKPMRWPALLTAATFVGSIAWTGHAASSVGEIGALHVAADTLHLLAAAAWVGGLVPFAMLLCAAWRNSGPAWSMVAYRVTRRFSALGVASVALLFLSGLINTWLLVGSLRGLMITAYGRLLVIKLCLFASMLLLAAINRWRLTPRLAPPEPDSECIGALRHLTLSCTAEIVLGVAVFAVVGLLGTLHPAIHFMIE